MISDHGEDATEHRQCGKNNMYDSGSRVALMLSGPGIAPGQVLGVDKIASLNDVFPTVMDMANLPIPDGLAGSSLLPLVNGKGDPTRRNFVTAQYHSVFSVTGEFMIRQVKFSCSCMYSATIVFEFVISSNMFFDRVTTGGRERIS